MTKAVAIGAMTLVLVFIAVAGILWWRASNWKRKALRENATNTEQDISDTYEKISDDMANDTDAEAWKRHKENIDSRQQ